MNFEYMWGWHWAMWISMMVVWILIILAAVAIFKWVTNFKAQSSESALDILKKRFAKGEISEEEFNKMKEKITERRD
jgi:putative membrane protein